MGTLHISEPEWKSPHLENAQSGASDHVIVMPYLFIGGSRDGQRMAVEKENVDLPVTENDHAVYGELKSTVGIKWEHYRSFRIRGELCEFVVYALAELSPDDILRTLLAKYRA